MLKGRNKAFAPKKIQRSAPRNEPVPLETSTLTSQQQNFEPLREIDATVVFTKDTPPATKNVNPEKMLPISHPPTEQNQSLGPQLASTPCPELNTRKDLKRPAESKIIEEPSSKRIATEDSQRALHVQGLRHTSPEKTFPDLNRLKAGSIPSDQLGSSVEQIEPSFLGENEPTADINLTGGKTRKKPGRKRSRKRQKTPEGAEFETIDPSVVTMQDLCKDLRIGRKSRHHDEIMGRVARLKREAVKAKMKRDFPELSDLISTESESTPAPREEVVSAVIKTSESTLPSGPVAGLKMRIVDGQIVTDEQSLRIDLHQRARANVVEEEVIEENDFSRKVVSSDYSKRERSQHWNALSNELFWRGLSMFGTDFEMIAKMFPDRTRRQIKLKFNAEERKNPKRLNGVLMGIKTEEIDLDEFQRLGNLELEDLGTIKAEEARIEEEQSEQLQIIEKAKSEETRRRKAEIHGASAAAGLLDDHNDDDQYRFPQENGRVKTRKPKKNMHSAYGGGEEVIVLGTIE